MRTSDRWDYPDKMAIEEAEHFDDISVVGFKCQSSLLLWMVKVGRGKDGSIDRYVIFVINVNP